jgi:ADP-ribose pyrophosphatase YjhB (NUDIX family)
MLIKVLHAFRRLYWYVVRPKTTGVRAAVFGADGQVMLVRHGYEPGLYLPGGGVKSGETPEDAILRELQEEIGMASYDQIEQLGSYENRREFKRDTVHLFVVRGVRAAAVDNMEIREVVSVPEGALPADVSPATRRRLHDVAIDSRKGGEW